MAYIPPNANGQATKANSQPMVLASDQDTLPVYTNAGLVGVEVTRPSETANYAINGVIADSASSPTLLTFTNLGRVNASSGYIVKASAFTDQKACVAQIRLHLFHTAPTAVNDKALFPLLYADKAKRVGYIDFPAFSSEDPTASTAAFALWTGQLQYICASASRTLYGIPVTKTVFTPANGQKFWFEISADQN